FGSLAWSDLEPIRQMGIYVPLGIGYACLLSIFFLPAVLCRIHLPAADPPEQGGVIGFFVTLPRRKGAILLAVALVLGIAAVNLPRLKVVSDPLLYFKEDSDIRQTFQSVEDTFGGALALIGEIPATCGLETLRSAECAEAVLEMERDLERMPGILSAYSLFDAIQSTYEAQTGDTGYPESPMAVDLILRAMDESDLASWYRDDGLRLVARTSDLDSEDVEALHRFRDTHPELRTLNGTPVLYNELNRLTVRSQVQSLGLALVLVFLMLVIAFRDPRAAVYALVPIAVTIVAVMGALVLTGYNLNMVTATLSAVTVGVGVDYAIHLISGIQYYRGRGLPVAEAVETALASVSRPVLASAFGLTSGISVMFFSPLHIHAQVATVMWVAMMISSLGALALIPLFYLRKGRGNRREHTAG
ncbi:MAG: MMPL family transporter, partial [Dehalococcoidia bacterium]|nr:MMPL family transporter [Dehalococcoidia bacterium]